MKTQETLEEVAEILIFKTIGGKYGLASSDEHDQVDGYFDTYLEAFITLKLKWQQGRMYSEEEVKYAIEMVITSGIVGDLLYKFWQRTSDACPLEATEAEKQEKEFKEWVMSLDWDKIINL